jgi:uncharacterized membrane protein
MASPLSKIKEAAQRQLLRRPVSKILFFVSGIAPLLFFLKALLKINVDI